MGDVTGADDGWWASLYDEHLARLLLEREEPAAAVAFLIRRLGLKQGDRVFDQCCGIGSLALPLARAGMEVVGWDLMEAYIERALREACDEGVRVALRAADAFDLAWPEPCSAGFNWWTGFGYARDDARNVQMLKRAFESLVPGGRFALDTMNVPGVIRGFLPEVITTRGEITLVRHSRLDVDRGLLHKRWSYTLAGGETVEHQSTVRLHTPWELRVLFQAAGFETVEFVGDLDGAPLEVDSPRCIALATRGDK